MIPQRFIEDIQSRTDIAEVIAGYIPLKKTGRNFKALCPFHGEKTPSFIVSPQKQIFHCFGCGEGGGVIQFVMLYEKVSFVEAVEILASRLGLEIPRQSKSPQDHLKKSLYGAVGEAAEFFSSMIRRSNESSGVRAYLESRAITDEAIEKFKIGYAPYRQPSLIEHMRRKGYRIDLLEKASLVTSRRDSGYIDMFRGRIMFPITDPRGRVLGFGGRLMGKKEHAPKYINSLENVIYRKRNQLYGLVHAKEEISRKDEVIVVEGYLDMIIPYMAGIRNIVASLGTALTEEQIRLLKRYTQNMTLVFDSDNAGQKASLRALDVFLENGVNVKIVALPGGFDPDSLVRARGKEAFDEVLVGRKDFFAYKTEILAGQYDIKTVQGKSELAVTMLSTIDKLTNEVEKFEYIRRLASLLHVREDVLTSQLRKSHKAPAAKKAEIRKSFVTGPVPLTEKMVIKFMLNDKDTARHCRDSLGQEYFTHPLARKAAALIFEETLRDSEDIRAQIMGGIEDREISRFLSGLLLEEGPPLTDELLDSCVERMKGKRQKMLNAFLTQRISEAEDKRDEEILKELIRKKMYGEVEYYG